MAFIEMKDIVKTYGPSVVLHGVSLSMEKGQVISIIGPSGAGKSTFLRCLNHLEIIQKGSICINGQYLARMDAEGNSVDTTDEQKAEIKKQAEEVLAQAKESGDFDAAAQTAEKTVNTGTYGSDDTLYDTLIKEAADQLDEGQFADLIETDTGYYLVRLDSKFDQEATDTKKESIVSQRKSEAYSAKIQEWKDAADFQVDDKVWGKINFDQPLEVKMENAQQ